MSITSRIEALRAQHETLSDAVETRRRSPSCDTVELAQLKKQKLLVKEEITRLTAQ